MLRDEIAGLLAEDFDLSLLGITDEDLDALLRDPDEVEGGAVEGEDDIPEPPVTPVSVQGDLWQLGSHRLICGDSTSAHVVGRLLGDACRAPGSRFPGRRACRPPLTGKRRKPPAPPACAPQP
jgi:hypothetical protein